ncbi:MAG: sensor histidine kinase, partial [Desulfocucumaceae bacterium]
MSENIQLRNIIDLDILQEVQDKFSEATGLAAIIADDAGQAITRPSKFSRHCQIIRSSSNGMKQCFYSDCKAGYEAAKLGKPYIHYCHAGLIDLATPIIVDGIYRGSVLCGQVLLEKPKSQHLPDKPLKFCKGSLGLDLDALMNALQEIEVVPEHRVKASAELLHIVGNYVVSISVAKLTQKKLLAEMKAREELETAIKTLELKALQSQVNPHFLFNTLNAVVKQAILEGASSTQEIVYSLAKLLRYNLGKINQNVTLKDEVANIRDYLFIQRTRFGDHVKAAIDIPEAIMNVKVPLMTLQPLVENAIVHGIEPKVEGGTIFIRGWSEEGYVILEIADSGLGMSKDLLEKIRKKSAPGCGQDNAVGIGIENVQKRIQLYFGPDYGLTVNSQQGQ